MRVKYINYYKGKIKMLENKDYQNYDYIEIIAKTDSADEIVNSYSILGWTENYRKEDRKYNDVIHISFSRPHKIENKDRLQLLQVYYENVLNDKAYLEEKKHFKSRIFISLVIAMAMALLCGIGTLVFLLSPILSYIISGLVILALALGLFFIIKRIRKLIKHEKLIFENKNNEFDIKIKEIMQEVKALRGINYEKE